MFYYCFAVRTTVPNISVEKHCIENIKQIEHKFGVPENHNSGIAIARFGLLSHGYYTWIKLKY